MSTMVSSVLLQICLTNPGVLFIICMTFLLFISFNASDLFLVMSPCWVQSYCQIYKNKTPSCNEPELLFKHKYPTYPDLFCRHSVLFFFLTHIQHHICRTCVSVVSGPMYVMLICTDGTFGARYHDCTTQLPKCIRVPTHCHRPVVLWNRILVAF